MHVVRSAILRERNSITWNIISSYERTKATNPEVANQLYKTCKLCEACTATTAAEGLFDPVKIAGGLGEGLYYRSSTWVDPINLAGCILKDQWPERDTLLISIGSGVFTEKRSGYRADEVFERNPNLVRADMRFRFNDTMLEYVLREDSDKFDHILNSATAYMDDEKVIGELLTCVGKLLQSYQMTSSASNH